MPIKPHLLALAPYLPPLEGRDSLKHCLLDFNERTIPTSQIITKAISDFLASDKLQQYPSYGNICQKLADYADVDTEQMMITNGSDQGIDLVFRAFSFSGGEAVVPAPTFAMYAQCAAVERLRLVEPNYDKETGYPVDEVLNSIHAKTAVVVISNPNNPCGTLLDEGSIRRIAAVASNAVVLIDECYFEYSKHTVAHLINEYPNIVVTRTFSKTWGIPSLRFGYLMACSETINALCNVRGPYDINQMAIIAAKAALDAPQEIDNYVDEVMQEAKPVFEEWLKANNISFWQSEANYVWVFPPNAEALNEHLIEHGFLVRPKAHNDQLGLRVTVGTTAQMEKLMNVWQSYIKNEY